MKIHDYCPGNGTRYQLALDSTQDGDMILLWLNPLHTLGGVCLNLGRFSHVNCDRIEGALNCPPADAAAILGWLKKTFNFTGQGAWSWDDCGRYCGGEG